LSFSSSFLQKAKPSFGFSLQTQDPVRKPSNTIMETDDERVLKQLDHMVKFIYREADEKANEISAKAQEEFTIEKQKMLNTEKTKMAKDFERKEKQLEVKKKNRLFQSIKSISFESFESS